MSTASPTRKRVPLWRRFRRRCYWALTVVLLRLARVMPLAWGRGLGRGLAKVGLGVRRREREVALGNLRHAFPDLDDRRRQRLLAEAAAAAGGNLWDTLAVPRVLADGLVGEEPCPRTGGRPVGDVIAELAAPGRGVLLLTGHLGCWELLGGWLGRELPGRGLGPLAVVTGRVHNPPVDRLLQDRRRSLGLVPLPRDAGARPLLRHLREGGVAAILLDQNVGARTEDVPFFGRPAPTAAGLAVIALRHGIPVLPIAIARDPGGRGHIVRHLAPLPPGGPAGDRGQPTREQVRDFLTECNGRLEELIRRNPAGWVWFHRRWNS